MPVDNEPTQDEFDAFLYLLSPNREEAGTKYEAIRKGLIRFFYLKGCDEPENLADITINRVAKKSLAFDSNSQTLHTSYFYGFAINIYKEQSRKKKPLKVLDENHLATPADSAQITENKEECFDACLDELNEIERKLAIDYFAKDKSAKFEHRRKIAENMDISINSLHVKIHRIKAKLRICIEKCMKKNPLKDFEQFGH